MTTFIVYAGPNGSGKSSVRDVIDSPVEVVIDPDRIARQINAADPRSVDPEAGRAAVRLFDDTIAARQSTWRRTASLWRCIRTSTGSSGSTGPALGVTT